MSKRNNRSSNQKDEMKERERLAELILKDCNIGLRYLTWANTPSENLKEFYNEYKLEPGQTRNYEEY